jgi:arginyl-tRNA synthetase
LLFIFQAANRAGWLPDDGKSYPKASHVGFGLVLGEDGKRFRTRDTEVVPLVDLLDEAKSRSKAALIERGMVVNNLFFVLFVTNVVSLSISCFFNHVYGISSILQLQELWPVMYLYCLLF